MEEIGFRRGIFSTQKITSCSRLTASSPRHRFSGACLPSLDLIERFAGGLLFGGGERTNPCARLLSDDFLFQRARLSGVCTLSAQVQAVSGDDLLRLPTRFSGATSRVLPGGNALIQRDDSSISASAHSPVAHAYGEGCGMRNRSPA